MQHIHAVRSRQATLSPTSLPESPRRRITIDHTSLEQLLKEELRMSILAQRHAQDQDEADEAVTYPEPLVHELNMADLERKERRREQNRRAAQRCRRKKRLNQMSVLQSYEWVISRNQYLQQEVDHLRQEMRRLNSVLKAHRNACTCTHVQKGPLHVLTANVKVEPGKDSPGPRNRTPPLLLPPPPVSHSRCLSLGPCQYDPPDNENTLVDSMGVTALSQQLALGDLQLNNQQTTMSYTTPQQAESQRNTSYMSPTSQQPTSNTNPPSFPLISCSMNYSPFEKNRPLADLDNCYNLPMMEEHPASMQVGVQNQDRPQEGFPSSVPVAVFGPAQVGGVSHQHLAPPDPDGAFVLLDDLAGLHGGAKPCIFQAEAATPLSADGRRSISSVSSDGSDPLSQDMGVSTGSPADVHLEEFHLSDDAPPHDFSQLLSQINQSDLLFHQERGLEEVFHQQAVGITSLPQHFLHNEF